MCVCCCCMLLIGARPENACHKRRRCAEKIYIYIYAISAASMAVYNNQHCLAGGEYEEFHSATVQSYNNIDWDRDAAEEEREIRLIIAYVVGYRNRFHHSYCFVICYGYWFMIEHLPVDEANMLFLRIKKKISCFECYWGLDQSNAYGCIFVEFDGIDVIREIPSFLIHFISTQRYQLAVTPDFFFIFWRSEYFSDE